MKKVGRVKRIKRINQNNPRLTPKNMRKYFDANYAGYNGCNYETHPFIYHCTDDEISYVIAFFQKNITSILTREYIADYFQSFYSELRRRGKIFDTSCTKRSNLKAHQDKRYREKVTAQIRREFGYRDDDDDGNYDEVYVYDENDYDEDEEYDESEYDEE